MTTKPHLPPQHVKARLSRDINQILAECLHHFQDEEREIKEASFDVDAIIAGKSVPVQNAYYRSVRPIAPYVRELPVEVAHKLTIPQKGNFIPASHFFKRFASV